jgi:hypothetical protein
MKTRHKIFSTIILVCFSFTNVSAQAQEEKPEMIVSPHYFVKNNSFQYLQVQTKLKANRKMQVLPGVVLKLFLDQSIPENLIAKVRTNEKGEAKAVLPVALKALWDSSATYKFLTVVEATSLEEETTTELEITKAKILIDTLNEDGVRTVTAQVRSYTNNEWIAAKDVEVKMGVRRMSGSNLKIGEDESYTTDSLGEAKGEFKVDSLPADNKKGDITLVAWVEDNEQFGNLSIEKTVPWGKYFMHENKFGQRSLWATRDKAPLWLLFMAFSIIAAVWGVICYLIYLLIRIKKIGSKEKTQSQGKPEMVNEALG